MQWTRSAALRSPLTPDVSPPRMHLGNRRHMAQRRMRAYLALSSSLFAATTLAACTREPRIASAPAAAVSEEARVEAALFRYAQLVLAMDHSALAELFTPEAEISHAGGTPVRGRAAIYSFLSSFVDYQVLEYSIAPASTLIHGDGAAQSGMYRQRVRTPQGQVLEVSGHFEAQWLRDRSGAWLISHMRTTPSP